MTIMLAYREVSIIPELWDDLRSGLVLIALVGMNDSLRDGIPSSVKICKEAGIKVRMTTGNKYSNAISVAKKAGIIPFNW